MWVRVCSCMCVCCARVRVCVGGRGGQGWDTRWKGGQQQVLCDPGTSASSQGASSEASLVNAPIISRDISKVILEIWMAARLTLCTFWLSRTRVLWGNHLPLAPTGKPWMSNCVVWSCRSRSLRKSLYICIFALYANSRHCECLSETIVTSRTLAPCPFLVQMRSGRELSPWSPAIVFSLSQLHQLFSANRANISQI